MEVWQLFKPLPVTMVTSMNDDSSYRCSPFTWLLPVNKGDCFVVMMRKESITLSNLKKRPDMTVSWMPASRVVAQLVKETKSPENPYSFEMVVPIGFKMPIPALSIYAMEGKVVDIFKITAVDNQTHEMVVCRGERVWVIKDFHLPLLHVGLKTFATAERFEVEGY